MNWKMNGEALQAREVGTVEANSRCFRFPLADGGTLSCWMRVEPESGGFISLPEPARVPTMEEIQTVLMTALVDGLRPKAVLPAPEQLWEAFRREELETRGRWQPIWSQMNEQLRENFCTALLTAVAGGEAGVWEPLEEEEDVRWRVVEPVPAETQTLAGERAVWCEEWSLELAAWSINSLKGFHARRSLEAVEEWLERLAVDELCVVDGPEGFRLETMQPEDLVFLERRAA